VARLRRANRADFVRAQYSNLSSFTNSVFVPVDQTLDVSSVCQGPLLQALNRGGLIITQFAVNQSEFGVHLSDSRTGKVGLYSIRRTMGHLKSHGIEINHKLIGLRNYIQTQIAVGPSLTQLFDNHMRWF